MTTNDTHRHSRIESTGNRPVPCQGCGHITTTLVQHWTGFLVPACDLACAADVQVRPVLDRFMTAA